MNKRFYLRQVDPELQDSDFFTTIHNNNHYEVIVEDDGNSQDFIITGNDRYMSYIPDKYASMQQDIENVQYDLENGIKLSETINYYFKKENGKKFSNKELAEIKDIIQNVAYSDEREAYAQLLSIISGKHWEFSTIRGCCQSEWNYIFYTNLLTRKDLNYIEACYFNVGYEWKVYESKEDFENEEESFDLYTYSNDKQEIAERLGVKESELEIYDFSGYVKTAQYKIA